MALEAIDNPPPGAKRALPVMRSIRSLIVSALDTILNVAVFGAIALGFGLWSSWTMVESGSRLTTRQSGPWLMWSRAGRPDADPYTRAHFSRQGSLPLSTSAVQTWEARADDDGQRLHSSCEYALQGDGIAAEWWSLAVYDDRGRLIGNQADRYAYNSSSVALGTDGSYIVTLARDARPGNWLPTGGAGRMVLVITRPASRPNATQAEIDAADRALPAIRRIACR